MANVDRPFGARFHSTTHGGPPQINKYKCTAAIIYPGDLVHMDGSGRVNTISTTETPMGVAASYVTAVAGQDVYVYDDLDNTYFEIQCDDGSLADDTVIGNYYDLVATTGDTTTLQSKQELDGDASVDDLFLVMGKVDKPDNAWGTNVKLVVKIRCSTYASVIAVSA